MGFQGPLGPQGPPGAPGSPRGPKEAPGALRGPWTRPGPHGALGPRAPYKDFFGLFLGPPGLGAPFLKKPNKHTRLKTFDFRKYI